MSSSTPARSIERPSSSSRSHEIAAQRYLVTGARGFIGRHLVRGLAGSGAQVHATTRRVPTIQAGVRWCRVDLADSAATQQMVDRIRPDVIIHLASRAEGARNRDLVVPMLNDNLLSAVNIMAAAASIPDCRVVLAGSIEENFAITSASGAHSPYAASKVAATAYATLFRDVWKLPMVVLRLAMVYGPDEPNRRRLIPYVIDSLLGGVAPKLSSGRRHVDWVYIDDVVEALVAAAVEEDAVGKIMDVGFGSLVSIHATVSLIADIVASDVAPEFGAVPDRGRDRDLVADPGPARQHLNWQPRVDLRTGIARTVGWHAGRASPGEAEAASRAGGVGTA